MKRYDLAFSLGAACSCSQSLWEAGLQFASYPFDWVCCPNVRASADAILSGLDGWLDAADLKLFDVRREPLSCKCYRNVRTGFLFVHDFPISESFEGSYPEVVGKFKRRAERLLAALGSGSCALAVYVEMPFRAIEPDDDYLYAQRRFRERFPSCKVDILIFRNREGVTEPEMHEISDGVCVVEMDIMLADGGEISHQVKRSKIEQWLREHVVVWNPSDPETSMAFEARRKRARKEKWRSANPLLRRMRQLSYKVYRWLERYLVGQNLVPREHPFRF